MPQCAPSIGLFVQLLRRQRQAQAYCSLISELDSSDSLKGSTDALCFPKYDGTIKTIFLLPDILFWYQSAERTGLVHCETNRIAPYKLLNYDKCITQTKVKGYFQHQALDCVACYCQRTCEQKVISLVLRRSAFWKAVETTKRYLA